MNKLIKHGCTLDTILNMTDDELFELIKEVNFNKKKVQHIKEAAKRIKNDHDGIVPSDFKTLVSFPGVGPKIAHLFL